MKNDATRSSRQSFLGKRSDRVLRDARIAIVGLCGGGSHVAQQLAHVGVGHFVLLDGDSVEESNLNRMIGSRPKHAQSRAPKADVIRDLVTSISPGAEVVAKASTWQENHLVLRECSAVFGCVDSFLARDELEKYCRRYLVPYIDIGMHVQDLGNAFSVSGQVVLSIPGMPCMRCLGFLSDTLVASEVQRYGAAGPRPQVVWPNGILASTAVGLFVQMVTPWMKQDLPLYLEYDGNRPALNPSRFASHLESRPCRHFTSAEDLGDVI